MVGNQEYLQGGYGKIRKDQGKGRRQKVKEDRRNLEEKENRESQNGKGVVIEDRGIQ